MVKEIISHAFVSILTHTKAIRPLKGMVHVGDPTRLMCRKIMLELDFHKVMLIDTVHQCLLPVRRRRHFRQQRAAARAFAIAFESCWPLASGATVS